MIELTQLKTDETKNNAYIYESGSWNSTRQLLYQEMKMIYDNFL